MYIKISNDILDKIQLKNHEYLVDISYYDLLSGSQEYRLYSYLTTFFNNITILDDSIFQEFSMTCIGEPKDLLRESFLLAKKKREQGKKIKFTYTPTGTPGKKPNFKFDNSSGEIIN